MSSEDPLRKIIQESCRGDEQKGSQGRVDKVSKSVSKKEAQSSIIDFGFVKIWTVLLEFLGVFYVRTQERKVENNKDKVS